MTGKMKRILITGANSFLGDNTKKYLEEHGDYRVDVANMLDDGWRKIDFSIYDVVFNVCAIVHRPEEKNLDLYFAVNRDLPIEIAKKAKDAGVKQFIQTSTNGVFGIDIGIMCSEKGYNPKTPYEKSKYQADCLLEELRSDGFKVCIVRPPLMYGKNCKGNFPKLEKFALNHNFFPSIKNKKDFIYIENMADFIKFSIDNELDEITYPRDNDVVAVSHLIKTIAEINGKKMHLLCIFNPFVKVFYKAKRSLKLVFGDCYCSEKVCSKEWTAPFSMEQAIAKMYK